MKQSSNCQLVILDYKKMKPLKWRFLKLDAPISADVPDATLQQTPAVTPEHGSATLEGGSAAPTQSTVADSSPTLIQG